jgi:L,D-transpeptidase catalytic domain
VSYRLLVLLTLALIAGAVSSASSAHSDVPDPGKSAEPRCVAGSVQRLGTRRRSFAVVARTRIAAFRSFGRGRLAEFGVKNINGVPTVFAVRARRIDGNCRARWYRVQLPMRPNGVRGWVQAKDVRLMRVWSRIVVDLSARRVTLFHRGRRVLSARAAIGTPATPTPTGMYYVNQRLIPSDPSGPFGPGAIGISAFSEVLTGWVQGGPVAIHGTNRPELIGRAVSNGCIRVRNDDLRRLFRRAPAGTPVLVRV